MKKYLLLSLACLLVFFAQGQEKENTVELGFNSLYFIQQLAKLGQPESVLVNAYGFSLKKIVGRNAFRMKLGFDYKKDGRPAMMLHTGTRMGYERRRKLHERVTVFFGAEGIFDYEEFGIEIFIFDPFFQNLSSRIIKIKEKIAGGGLFFGVDFKLNDRLSLTTDSGFTYTQSIKRIKNFDVLGPANKRLNSVGFDFPTSIFLAIKFNRKKNE